MKRNKFGKFILSFVLVVGAIVSTAVDWNTTHLFNPAWHPHARFHDALFLLFMDAASLIVLWLLWRPGKEPDIGIKVAALFSAAAWTPFFYIEALIPGTNLLATDKVPELRQAGKSVAPNQIVAAVLLLLTAIAYWLARDVGSDA